MPNKRRLIIGPSWLGDMVMTQSLLKLLKARWPEDTLDVVAPNSSLAIVERMPEVDIALSLNCQHGRLQWRERRRVAAMLAARNYCHVIVIPNSFKSALVPYWSKIPRRTGWRGEWRYGLLNDIRVLNKQRYPLMVERLMALALEPGQDLPAPSAFWPALCAGPDDIRVKFALHPQKPMLALCPGAAFGLSKRWPVLHYQALARHYLDLGWQVLILGSQQDAALAQMIEQDLPPGCFHLAGQTNLSEVVDLLAVSQLVVSNDSGLMHVAAALQRPLVVIYGGSNPSFTPPLSDQATILQLELDCQPCFARTCRYGHYQCLNDISPLQVISACQARLQS